MKAEPQIITIQALLGTILFGFGRMLMNAAVGITFTAFAFLFGWLASLDLGPNWIIVFKVAMDLMLIGAAIALGVGILYAFAAASGAVFTGRALVTGEEQRKSEVLAKLEAMKGKYGRNEDASDDSTTSLD
jgi:hypothetical protein